MKHFSSNKGESLGTESYLERTIPLFEFLSRGSLVPREEQILGLHSLFRMSKLENIAAFRSLQSCLMKGSLEQVSEVRHLGWWSEGQLGYTGNRSSLEALEAALKPDRSQLCLTNPRSPLTLFSFHSLFLDSALSFT